MGAEVSRSFLHIFQGSVEISNGRQRNKQINNKVQFDSRRVYPEDYFHGDDSAQISEVEKRKHMDISSKLAINWTPVICSSFPPHVGIAHTVLGKGTNAMRFSRNV